MTTLIQRKKVKLIEEMGIQTVLTQNVKCVNINIGHLRK